MRKLPVKIKPRFLSDRVSKILFVMCIFCLCLMTASQVFLKNKNTREMFTNIEKYEKILYASNEVFEKGSVMLYLENAKPSEKIEIWLNGEKVGFFEKNEQEVSVECDGVIEVKNDSGENIIVYAQSKSDNAELLMSNRHEISSGIRVICYVKLNS